MRLSYYFVLIFTLQLGLYLIGYQSPLLSLWSNQHGGPIDPASFLTMLANAITSDAGITSLLLIAALTIASLFLGFSAMFIIPLSILMVLSNLFVFPTQFFDASCVGLAPGATCTPPFFVLPILIIMNMLLIFAYIEFVRGAS